MNNSDKLNIKEVINVDQSGDISPLEIKRIKEAIERSDTEKFLLFTRLMRIHFMLKNAVITTK
jgi:hypothetical protein